MLIGLPYTAPCLMSDPALVKSITEARRRPRASIYIGRVQSGHWFSGKQDSECFEYWPEKLVFGQSPKNVPNDMRGKHLPPSCCLCVWRAVGDCFDFVTN